MDDVSRDIRRNRENQYFLKQEQMRMEEMRRQSERQAQTVRLMEAFGIRDQDLVRELSDAGFDIDTFRLLYLVPLEIAGLHGIKQGGAAHERLRAWLDKRPSDRFFKTCLRGIKAMIGDRPPRMARKFDPLESGRRSTHLPSANESIRWQSFWTHFDS